MRRKAALVVIVGLFGACGFETPQFTGDAAPPPVTVGFAQQTSLQDEASGEVEVIVRLSRPAPEPIAVGYAFTGGSANIDQDYTGSDGTLSFQTGETERGFLLTILPDAIEEEDETIELSLSAPSGGAALGNSNHTITISKALLPRVNFELETSAADEPGTLLLTLSLDKMPLLLSTVTLAAKPLSTATEVYDYTMPSNLTLTFQVNSLGQSLPVTIITDTVDEEDETMIFEMMATTNVIIGTKKEHTHTIRDNDDAPTVSITTGNGNAAEGNTGSTNVNVTVMLSGPSQKLITVPLTFGTGTATEGTDFGYTSKAALVFNPNVNHALSETSKTFQFSVTGEAVAEANQTVITGLGTPTNATLGATTSHTYTINNDDQHPTVVFTTANQTVGEGDSSTNSNPYVMTFTGATELVMQYDVVLSGTATYTDDYTSTPAATMTGTIVSFVINPGTGNATVTLVVIGEMVVEGGDETIIMTIAPSSLMNIRAGAAAGQTRTHTIDDSDP